METQVVNAASPNETFVLGERLARQLSPGQVVLLYGGLGAGKTLLAKGILSGLGFNVDEVTSPSFTLVNLYKTTSFDVYHIDLWRLDGGQDVPSAVGLEEITEGQRAVTIIEWADRLGEGAWLNGAIKINIAGDGDDPRRITIEKPES